MPTQNVSKQVRAPMPGTSISGIRTIGIPVKNQDRALAFYRDNLGFDVLMDAAYGEGARWIEVAPTGALTSIALVPERAGSPAGLDTGVRLVSRDATADHERLRGSGVDVDAEVQPYPVPMFTFRDPDANQLYVVEEPAEG
jgi:catechol 2,3-dioxygenase-like lactoylglutathione lyase family enzyme